MSHNNPGLCGHNARGRASWRGIKGAYLFSIMSRSPRTRPKQSRNFCIEEIKPAAKLRRLRGVQWLCRAWHRVRLYANRQEASLGF